MLFNKKGDLAISTNAIVILIIAVIMLGLIIAFVTQGFGAASDNLLGDLKNIDDPEAPTARSPITTSGGKLVNAGKEFGIKVSVFNPTAEAEDVKPTLDCTASDAAITFDQVSEKEILPKSYAMFEIVGSVDKAVSEGRKLCVIEADEVGVSEDFVFEVRT